MTQTVAQMVVDVMEGAGVRHCYGIVGDTLNHVTAALSRSSIEWVHVRHEEAGALAAQAEALLTGHLTACAGSCGPGSLHFINGIFEAQRNRAPLLLIASQLATGQLGTQFPQEVDFASVYRTCTVFCQQINHAGEAQRILVQACQAALTLRGVALVILPVDVSQAEVPPGLPYRIHRPQPVLRPSDAELLQMAQLIEQGHRIGIYCGSGCEGAHTELMALANRLKAPIAHTSRAKDFVEPNNPVNMGCTGMMGVASGMHMVSECDTLLLLGADFAWSQFYPQRARILQIDREPLHLGRRHPVDLGVVGDVVPTLQALLPLLAEKQDTTFLQACLTEREKTVRSLRAQERPGTDDLIHPQHVFAMVNRHAAEDAVVTADAGSPMSWILRHFDCNGQRRTLASLLHGTMAAAMPSALGAQKAFPGRQVIAMSGDGGLTMLLGDLLTAVQEKLPIKIIVINNGSLNFVELEQKVEGLVNHYTDLLNPDFARLAEVMGWYGRKVTRSQDVEQAVVDLLAQPGPGLLDVHTSRYELVLPPQIEASQVLGTALYSAKALISGHASDVQHLLVDNFLK